VFYVTAEGKSWGGEAAAFAERCGKPASRVARGLCAGVFESGQITGQDAGATCSISELICPITIYLDDDTERRAGAADAMETL